MMSLRDDRMHQARKEAKRLWQGRQQGQEGQGHQGHQQQGPRLTIEFLNKYRERARQALVSPAMLDFLRDLLVYAPEGRLTAAQALCHPWILDAPGTLLQLSAATASVDPYRHSEARMFMDDAWTLKQTRRAIEWNVTYQLDTFMLVSARVADNAEATASSPPNPKVETVVNDIERRRFVAALEKAVEPYDFSGLSATASQIKAAVAAAEGERERERRDWERQRQSQRERERERRDNCRGRENDRDRKREHGSKSHSTGKIAGSDKEQRSSRSDGVYLRVYN
jgi:serine/threonine protein kinase